jgi:predicted nuclease of predicted toxin-antitoxin system
MKILLDEGLPRRAAAFLREQGLDAVHLTEIADPSTDDRWILETARATGRLIVTLDADFHALLAVNGWSSPSVVRIRRQGLSAGDVAELVALLISDHAAALTAGAALSVRAHLVGIRRLPLTTSYADDGDSDDEG